MSYEICSRCNASNSIKDDYISGITVCTSCGLVYQENIIIDEYEIPKYKDKNKRIDIPENPDTMNNLGTTLQVETNGITKNFKTFQNLDQTTKNILFIQKFLENAEIETNIIEKTKDLYYILAKNKNLNGLIFQHVILALYFKACMELNQHISFEQITYYFNITVEELKKTYTLIDGHLLEKTNDDKKEQAETQSESQKETQVEDQKEVPKESDLIQREKNYIRNFYNADETKYYIKLLAFEIIENINNNSILEGKAPKTIVGLTLLLSNKLLNDNIDDSEAIYKEFSKKATLRKYLEEIKDSLTLILPKEYHDKIDIIKKFRI